MYHRFELYIDDEKQDIGILMGISELDGIIDDEILSTIMNNFEENLPLPTYYLENPQERKNVRAFFTKKGLEFFRNDIDNLMDIYENHGLFNVRGFSVEEDGQNVVYEDEYQVLIRVS